MRLVALTALTVVLAGANALGASQRPQDSDETVSSVTGLDARAESVKLHMTKGTHLTTGYNSYKYVDGKGDDFAIYGIPGYKRHAETDGVANPQPTETEMASPGSA